MPEQVRTEVQGITCQSCGMPMERPEQRGTDSSGARVGDYCGACYRDGRFVEPTLTKQQMITRIVNFLMTNQNMPEHAARGLAHHVVPRLKRWLNGAA